MAILNGYTTLQAVKDLLRITETDTTDDGVINDIITQASRYCDDTTGRRFYPSIETHKFDVPEGRAIWFDDDLLSVISVTNGDDVAVAAADYILVPANVYPKYAIALTEATSVYWDVDSNNNAEQVIDINAWWGFRQQFTARGWLTGSTLNEGAGLNATDVTFTVTAGTSFKAGQIIKIENEIMNVSVVATNDITVPARGDNGSTAATHANATAVYIWSPEPDIELATKIIVRNLYHNRFGQNSTGTPTITSFGVVLAPEDVPASATKLLQRYTRIVP